MSLTINVSPFGVGTTSWTLAWRVLGTSTFNTTNVTPANPISASTTTAVLNVPNENTIYELRIIANCGSSTSQSAIFRRIARECPTLLASNVSTTDSSITVSVPVATPSPISNHIANILVEVYQGLTLISNQLITNPNSVNTVTFTGLNQNTTYTIKSTITYQEGDSIPQSSYPNGATNETQICTFNVVTDTLPTCQVPVIISISES